MPDILLFVIIIALVLMTCTISGMLEGKRPLYFLVVPFALLIWWVYAGTNSWERVAIPCNVSEIVLPNGGKASAITYMNGKEYVTKVLPYLLDNTKNYVVEVRNEDRNYSGIYFVGNKGNSYEMNIRPVSPEVDNK